MSTLVVVWVIEVKFFFVYLALIEKNANVTKKSLTICALKGTMSVS